MSARRFYGLEVGSEVLAAVRESLTSGAATADDLIDAHLAINRANFGGLDKTLAGFVIVDDEGDDYTLLDVRDGGQLWWQDHETRELALEYDTLADLIAVRAEIAEARDRRAVQQAYRAETPRGTRRVSGPLLVARYQWLVWLLAKRPDDDAAPSIDLLVRNAVARFRHVWPRKGDHDAAFARELADLADDPHLAIYWLLHTTMLADEVGRARVVDAIGDAGPELCRAFVARFATLPLAGDVPVVAEFRARRAAMVAYGGFEHTAEQAPAELLRALEIDPTSESLGRALPVTAALDRGVLARETVAAVLARIPAATTGTTLLRAFLERTGDSSDHADAFVRLIAARAAETRWWLALEGLWLVHERAYDGDALLAATRVIVARDRYHRRGLQMAMRAASIGNASTAALEDDLEIADAIRVPYQQLKERPGELARVTEALASPARRGLAWRVLQRAEINRPVPAVMAWAAGEVLAGDELGGPALVAAALATLDARSQGELIGDAERAIDGAAHPLVGVLLAMLDGGEPPDGDLRAYLEVEHARERAVRALAPWVHDAAVFDRLLALVERPAGRSVQDPVWSKLFSPFQTDTYVVPRLAAAQAVRVASALVATQLRHPQIHARNAAGHALHRFSHPGAERFLIDALVEYGERNANQVEPGTRLDHGKAERDQLADIVANLYNAVRGLETDAARTALVERLFAERRSFWRMATTLGDAFDAALHGEIMATFATRRDARAAGCYAYALVTAVKQGPPLVELGRLISAWEPGDDPVGRGFFRYALVVAQKAALDIHDHALVRLLHAAQVAIAEPALEPDDHRAALRGRSLDSARPDRVGWKSPFADPQVQVALERALSGAADRDREALVEAATAARAARTPNLAITDAQLGQLAGATVAIRLLHDRDTGVIWFRDTDDRLHYFDGYAVVPPPFEASPVGQHGLAALLTGTTRIDERAMWWDAERERFREVIRIGDRLLVSWGPNNAGPSRHFLWFADEAAAIAALAIWRVHVPDGYAASDPYYLANTGAIVRTYYVPLPGGGYNADRDAVWVLETRVCRDDHGSPEAAIAEHERRELAWMRDRDATLTCVESSHRWRRASDLTVREWVAARFRDDSRDPIWHLGALDELAAYLDEFGLRTTVPELDVQLGAPASDEDIDAFAAERTHPVPESLRALWRAHGRASWKLGEVGRRLLGPREVLARREAAREIGEMYLRRYPEAQAAQHAAVLGTLDVLVESLDGTPVTFLGDLAIDDSRVFAHAVVDPEDLWWESSLAWTLATRFLGDLEVVLADAAPILERLAYGQQTSRHERRVFLERDGTFWEAIIDVDTGVVATRFGKLGHTGATTVERMAPAAANQWLDDKVEEKWSQGYRDVGGPVEVETVAIVEPAAVVEVIEPELTVAARPAVIRPAATPVATPKAARKPKAATKKPVAKKPIVKKPVAKKPVAKKPVAKKPVAKKPVVKKPAPKVSKPKVGKLANPKPAAKAKPKATPAGKAKAKAPKPRKR